MRIAKWKIEEIVKTLTHEKFTKKLKKARLDAESKFSELANEITPENVKKVLEDRPDVFTSNWVSVIFEVNTDKHVRETFTVKGLTLTEQADLQVKAAKSKIFLKKCRVAEELSYERKIFMKKLKCTIEKIGTYGSLKKEFPEAYKVLIALDNKEASSTDFCTEVESLRAELNSK